MLRHTKKVPIILFLWKLENIGDIIRLSILFNFFSISKLDQHKVSHHHHCAIGYLIHTENRYCKPYFTWTCCEKFILKRLSQITIPTEWTETSTFTPRQKKVNANNFFGQFPQKFRYGSEPSSSGMDLPLKPRAVRRSPMHVRGIN